MISLIGENKKKLQNINCGDGCRNKDNVHIQVFHSNFALQVFHCVERTKSLRL